MCELSCRVGWRCATQAAKRVARGMHWRFTLAPACRPLVWLITTDIELIVDTFSCRLTPAPLPPCRALLMRAWMRTTPLQGASSTCWPCMPSQQQTPAWPHLQPTLSATCGSWPLTQPACPACRLHPLQGACQQVGTSMRSEPMLVGQCRRWCDGWGQAAALNMPAACCSVSSWCIWSPVDRQSLVH